jgi:hypothetical protein
VAIKVVTGSGPLLSSALAWLERRGIPAREIRAVSMDATVGRPMILTVELIVPDPDEMTAA